MIPPCKEYDNAYFYSSRQIQSNNLDTWKRRNEEEVFEQQGRAQAEREQRHRFDILMIEKARILHDRELSRQQEMDEKCRLFEEEAFQRQRHQGERRKGECRY
eukprot:CAMPEP_0172480830 /NCGR_PEP_ID=MMETSP1066-20121228/6288_1 /TAXON_ID=671091 /ORGANISM="Coscinodiscus wailesii, Strain CCMP2513" /LENGTH=102 /DNA_ID=CAMNT_0013242535 /DNA_START=237 /DNA_END=545 /DNA_ORIENTATION=-